MLPHELDPFLIEQVRLQKRMHWLGALTMAAVMIVCGGLAWLALSAADAQRIMGLAGFGLIVSALMVIPGLGDPRKTRAARTLRDRAQEIVWIYPEEVRGQSASQWVVLCMEGGARVRFPAFSKRRESEVFALIAALAPQAAQGFHPDLEMAFLKDPSSLRSLR